MTDTEKAINWFERRKDMYLDDVVQRHENVALEALQEKAERDKGCEWCDYFSKSKNLISNGNGQYEEIPHKYCGKCGKELVCK